MWRLACVLFAVPLLADQVCLPVSSSYITPRELAASLPVFAKASDQQLRLAPSPPPGQSRPVAAREIAAWARLALVSDLGGSNNDWSALCLARPAHRLLKSEVEAAIRPLLPEGVSLEVATLTDELLPPGHAVFSAAAASKPSPLHPRSAFQWQGLWEVEDGKPVPIWARVSAWRTRAAVRLKIARPERAVLTVEDLEQVQVDASPFDPLPDESITGYAGLLLKHFLPAGTLLERRQVETPPRVARNDMIDVHVISGHLRLELMARAESDGWVGDSVALVAPTGLRRFRAVVQPDGSALLVVNTRSMPVRQGAENTDENGKISN